MHLRLRPQSHCLRVRSALPLSRLGIRRESRFLLSPLAEVCWWVFKRVALSIPGFVGLLESSGSIPPWFTTTRLFEQPSVPMPPTDSLDQEDVCGREAIHLLFVGTFPSLKSGSIDFWCTFTRFSARSLNGMQHALCQYRLLNSFALCFFSKEWHFCLSRPGERKRGHIYGYQHIALEHMKRGCRSFVT